MCEGGSYATRMGRVRVWNTFMDEHTYLVRRWRNSSKRESPGHGSPPITGGSAVRPVSRQDQFPASLSDDPIILERSVGTEITFAHVVQYSFWLTLERIAIAAAAGAEANQTIARPRLEIRDFFETRSFATDCPKRA